MTPRKVLIVGGGTAGWMTAAHLNAVLNRDGRKVVDISLIESPDKAATCVGETTMPGINRFLAILGVDQREFMQRVGATFKQSTRFVNWLHNNEDYFHHPFSMERPGIVDRSAQRWLKSNRSVPFAETVSAQPQLCEMGVAPLMLTRWDFGTPLSYAFHLDELKFADYLRELSTARGVKTFIDHLADIEKTENGHIAAVNTKSGQHLEADLYIDCSGSEGALIGEELGVTWIDRSEWLLCDRVLTLNVPYEQHYPGHVHPYTTSTALSAGWVWDIPLQDSRSLGYVHCSAFLGEDEAEKELRTLEGVHAESLQSSLIPYRTGHRESAWVGNCVSIGAASSFVESLEGTSLYMIELAAEMLVDHFPYADDMAPLAYRYNRIMVNRYYEILDFVNLHYCLTRRTDTEFWREVQKPERINKRLQAKLDFWRIKRPTPSDFEDQHFPGQSDEPLSSNSSPGDHRNPVDTAGLWGHENYEIVLYGMDFLDAECDEWFGTQRPNSSVARHVIERLNMAPQKLPPHDVWLRQFCSMPDYRNSDRTTEQ
jgi:tryptophan halogenase